MKSIMVINSKGGSGKTTVSVNLAAYCAQFGLKTTLVDLDPQESSTQWLEARPSSKAKINGTKNFNKPLKKEKKSVVIYDVPAAIYGSRLDTYVKKANMIIVPVLPSPIDMKAAKVFIQHLRSMGPVIRNQIKGSGTRARAFGEASTLVRDKCVK